MNFRSLNYSRKKHDEDNEIIRNWLNKPHTKLELCLKCNKFRQKRKNACEKNSITSECNECKKDERFEQDIQKMIDECHEKD